MAGKSLLLIDDDESGRLTLGAILEDAGYQVTEASTLGEARALLGTKPFHLAVIDVELPDGRGPDLLPQLAETHPGIALAVMSGHDRLEVPLAHVYITKACAASELLSQLETALTRATGDRG